MPSVKIKKSYQRIPEGIDGQADNLDAPSPASTRRRTRSRTIASIFNHDQFLEDLPAPTQPFARPASSAGRGSIDAPTLSNKSSRVSFATDRNRRFSGSHAGPSGRRSQDVGGNEFTISETPQLELLIPAHPQPGLVERSFDGPDNLDIDVEHHEDAIVEHLEAIDPEIATVADLSNAANSIMFPPLNFYSRKPVIQLPRRTQLETLMDTEQGKKDRDRDYDELDQHVDDVLSKRAKIRRSLRGLWKFLKTPQGIIVGIYGFLVAFWGAALVLFLGKLINLHNDYQQGFWVEISSQIVNGLFTATGVGLIPWRLIDTWRIVIIWHYKRKTRKLRKKAGIPPLIDEDDLPDPMLDPNYVHVLTDEQQFELRYRMESSSVESQFADALAEQFQFQKSQTFYRPHGTSTHRAFPINLALLVCLFIDGNSLFQVLLCYCMWGYDRFHRPPWTTGSLIPLSFLCGIAAAVVIWYGGRQTRRTKEVEKRLKAALAFERHTGLPAGITATCSMINGKTGKEEKNENTEKVEKVEGSSSSSNGGCEKTAQGKDGSNLKEQDYSEKSSMDVRTPEMPERAVVKH